MTLKPEFDISVYFNFKMKKDMQRHISRVISTQLNNLKSFIQRTLFGKTFVLLSENSTNFISQINYIVCFSGIPFVLICILFYISKTMSYLVCLGQF